MVDPPWHFTVDVAGVIGDISPKLHEKFEIHEWRHASAVLVKDFPDEWADITDVLGRLILRKSWIEVGGGNESKVSKFVGSELKLKGWAERKFKTAILVDGHQTDSPTHKVDCFKNKVGLEVEWNNKDPFFDRDLNNFRLLFELRALSVGIILTRCDELQRIFDGLGRGKAYGNTTTQIKKLLPRLEGGAGGGCPVLVFGIRSALYDPNQ